MEVLDLRVYLLIVLRQQGCELVYDHPLRHCVQACGKPTRLATRSGQVLREASETDPRVILSLSGVVD
jgi:hypothetical protein